MGVRKWILQAGVLRKATFLILFLLIAVLVFHPQNVTPVAAANSVIYNLYATDGFIALADGTILYNYGFVGGRAGQTITYQVSAMGSAPTPTCAGTPNMNCTVTLPASPAAGPIVPGSIEAQILGDAQFPAPIITAAVGDVVEIRLKNLGVANKGSPNDPHSIHLHGLDVDAANDGVPETSVGAVPANLQVLDKVLGTVVPAPGAGNVVVYMFSPTYPGTFFYHCHQEADIHVQMGMYGALIIYNPGEAGATTGPGSPGSLYGWSYNKDVVMLLSEIDVRQHVSEQKGLVGGNAFNPVNYQPQYWLINGLSFPNTIHASAVAGAGAFNWTNWITAHPGYESFITGKVSTQEKVLIRMINMGFETQPLHMHGFHGKIIGKDQRAWPWANTPGVTPWGQGMEINTLTIGSGEAYDWLINFGLQAVASTYQPNVQSRYDPGNPALATGRNLPKDNTQTQFQPIPVPNLPGATYIGGPTVTGAIGFPPMSSQLFPFHNHDDYKATNNGVYPGGMFTMIMPY